MGTYRFTVEGCIAFCGFVRCSNQGSDEHDTKNESTEEIGGNSVRGKLKRILSNIFCRLLQTLPEYQAQQAQQTRANESATITAVQKTFNMFDVKETSYHFFSQRIDLHLCDDAGGKQETKKTYRIFALKLICWLDYFPFRWSIVSPRFERWRSVTDISARIPDRLLSVSFGQK